MRYLNQCLRLITPGKMEYTYLLSGLNAHITQHLIVLSRSYKNMAACERHNIQECKDMIGRENHMRRCLRGRVRRGQSRLGLGEGGGRVRCPDIAERAPVGEHEEMNVGKLDLEWNPF